LIKHFVVSDIHGHYNLLQTALDSAGFDMENPEHILICCGDYFDRGDENLEVLRFFERLKHKVLLRGNHEDLLLSLFKTGKLQAHNYINGSLQTIKDFFGKYVIAPLDDTIDFSGKTRMLNRVCEFIEGTVNYYETKDYVFVHGWLPEGADTAEKRSSATDAEWEKARCTKWTQKYKGERPLADKTLVCGHMPTFFANRIDNTRSEKCSDIFYGNGLIAIDAGTYDSKRVNVFVF